MKTKDRHPAAVARVMQSTPSASVQAAEIALVRLLARQAAAEHVASLRVGRREV